jgi:hypothetical protein
MGAEEIADRVFQAGLVGMDETQRAAAVEARDRAKTASNTAQAAAARPAQGTGLTGMVMPQGGPGMRQNRNAAAGGAGVANGQRRVADGTSPGREAWGPPKPLWFIDETGKPDCILVQTGISNGSFTEIRARNADIEGRQIVLRERVQ